MNSAIKKQQKRKIVLRATRREAIEAKIFEVLKKELILVIGYIFGIYIEPTSIKNLQGFNKSITDTFRKYKLSGLVNTMYSSLLRYLITKKEYKLYYFTKNILYSSHSRASIRVVMEKTNISNEDDIDLYHTGNYLKKNTLYKPETLITNDLLIITNLEYRTDYTNMTESLP